MREMLRRAGELGLSAVEGEVLHENRTMLRLVRAMGGRSLPSNGYFGTERVRFDLPLGSFERSTAGDYGKAHSASAPGRGRETARRIRDPLHTNDALRGQTRSIACSRILGRVRGAPLGQGRKVRSRGICARVLGSEVTDAVGDVPSKRQKPCVTNPFSSWTTT